MANVKGSIYYRGKKNHVYFHYMIDGNRITLMLRDENNQPICKGEKEKIAISIAKIMAPFALKTEKDQLEHAAMAIRTVKEKIRNVEQQTHGIMIGDGWEFYRKSPFRPDSGERTMGDYAGYWQRFAAWCKTHRINSLDQITPSHAAEYCGDLDDQSISRGTWNHHIGFLKLFFRVALQAEAIVVNPFNSIVRRRNQQHHKQQLTPEMVEKIFAIATGEMRLLCMTGYYLGDRLGDCCTWDWSQIALERGVTERTFHKTQDRNPTPVKKGIPQPLMVELLKIPVTQRHGPVMPEICRRYHDVNKRTQLSVALQRLFQQVGIQTRAAGTGGDKHKGKTGKPRAVVQFGFHSFRYTNISRQMAQGIAPGLVQKSAGHASPVMTDQYTQISDETARRIAEQFCEIPSRYSLSSQVILKLQSMTDKNWRQIRDELLS